MKKGHQHRAVMTKRQTYGWGSCVLRRWHAGSEHGNIMYRDVCRCGAVREAESNAGIAYGDWHAA